MYVDNTQEELSRQSLVRQAATINNSGRAYLRQSDAAERATSTRQEFTETHKSVGRITIQKISQHLWFTLGIAFVYFLDVFILGGSAQHAAALMSDDALAVKLAQYLYPAAIIVIEVMIAMKIEHARQEAQFAFGSSAKRWGWFALGVVVALIVPFTARALAESAGAVDGNDSSSAIVAVLAIISFAAHVLILFGGQEAEEAKAYFLYLLAKWFHTTREDVNNTNAKETLAAFNAQFISYVHAWREHNRLYTQVPSGPFDVEVVGLLKQQFPQITTGINNLPVETES